MTKDLTFDLPALSDGHSNAYADLPKGVLANIETSLERAQAPDPERFPLPAGYELVEPEPVDLDAFKALFHAVGDPWLWFGRLAHGDEAMHAILTATTTTLRYLYDNQGKPVGLFESQQQGSDTLEVSYFGLVQAATGKKLGPALMEHGLAAAWNPQIKRIWLHTCTLDSPHALGFYQRQGFRPFKQRIEIAQDPRLTGVLPRNAAPHIPLADFSDR